MLRDEQAAELLRRCEAIVGRELKQVRGNLRKASTRADAVWELIVVEAAAQLGRIDYESIQGGPDIRLELPTGRWVSIEVTYLHPRFEDEERRSAMIVQWLHEATASIKPYPPEVRCEFHGDDKHQAGPKRILPKEHEKKNFLASEDVSGFLSAVRSRPTETHELMLTDYSVTLMASPRRSRFDGFHSWGGLVQETPKVVEEHAAYRAIREKLRQHKVNEPHLVCIGSDVSPVLSSVPLGWGIRLEQALSAAVQKSSELSGVLVVNIEQTAPAFGGVTRTARCTAYPIPNCRYPLTEDEWAFIRNLDLNRWKYTNSLPIKEVPPAHRVRHVSGPIQQSTSPGGQVKLTIPTNVLVDVLAGRTQLLSQCGGEEDNFGKSVAQCLQEGWSIIGCSFQDGDLQQGISASVEIELAPPYASVFWPPK